MKKKAVVLFSGGLDSTTLLYHAINEDFDCYCLIFDYGQKHSKEILKAKKIAENLNVKYDVVKFDMSWIKSFLVNKNLEVPNSKDTMHEPIPPSYVPGRNTVFLSFAISYAETIKADYIMLGLQESPFPDGKENYLNEMQRVIDVLGVNIKISVPFAHYSKAEIVRLGLKLGVPYEKTWSCFAGKEQPCNICEACVLRKIAFNEVGIADPIFEKK